MRQAGLGTRIGVVFFLSFVLGCAATSRFDSLLLERLKNRGPVPLSADNPYLASNLLVSQEMAQSDELRGFIEHRGAPEAVEITQGFFSDLSMTFYYPKNKEYYFLDDIGGTWAIHGPETMSGRQIDRVNKKLVVGQDSGTSRSTGAALIPVATPSPSVSERNNPRPIFEAEPTIAPTPKQAAAIPPPRIVSSKQISSPQAKLPKEAPSEVTPADEQEDENIDLQLSKYTKDKPKDDKTKQDPGSSANQAELTPKGDLVHYVTVDGQSLQKISEWYTGSSSNAATIQRINKLGKSDQLNAGDEVVIPKYLLKTKQRMPE